MAENAYTVTELINSALTRIRSETGDTAELYATGLEEFNDALMEIITDHPSWRWTKKETTEVTVADQKEITLPDDCLNVREIYLEADGTDVQLSLMDDNEAGIQYPNDSDTGSPEAYVIGVFDVSDTAKPAIRQIDIKPTPDNVYTLYIHYTYAPIKYTTSNDDLIPPVPHYVFPPLKALLKQKMLTFTKHSRGELQEAEKAYLYQLSKAIRMDKDRNKGVQSIKLAPSVRTYRSVRYSQ